MVPVCVLANTCLRFQYLADVTSNDLEVNIAHACAFLCEVYSVMSRGASAFLRMLKNRQSSKIICSLTLVT